MPSPQETTRNAAFLMLLFRRLQPLARSYPASNLEASGHFKTKPADDCALQRVRHQRPAFVMFADVVIGRAAHLRISMINGQ